DLRFLPGGWAIEQNRRLLLAPAELADGVSTHRCVACLDTASHQTRVHLDQAQRRRATQPLVHVVTVLGDAGPLLARVGAMEATERIVRPRVRRRRSALDPG